MRFCIVGTGRCGSTVLRNALDLHPEMFVFPETHWIPKMYEAFGTGRGTLDSLISIVERTRHVTGDPVTAIDAARVRERFDDLPMPTVSEFCDRLGRIFAEEAGKMSWADKTPDYGPHLETLQRLWPRCRFVHIVRHGAAVAKSMSRHPGYQWLAGAGEVWWCPPSFNGYYRAVELSETSPRDFVVLWYRRLMRIGNEIGRLRPGSYLEVRFEDLVAEPVATFRRISGFLELPAQPSWLAEAAGLVDPNRVRSHPTSELLSLLEEPERRLLTEHGY